MLSHQELRNIRRQLEDNPSKNLRKKLKKKLKEHEYASMYQPFTPLPHQRHFINRKTEEQTLIELIQVATDSTIFLLDTESVLVRHQPNRPGLIQLEIIPSDTLPVVLIIEVNHLPPTHSHAFQLIRQLFRIVLDSENVIYTWGIIAELNEFVQFNLFNPQQIESCDNRNLQDIFKQYWQQCHEHKRRDDCQCEECIGKDTNEQWSLQDAVAYQLEEWLDKRHTCSPFDMGLDPRLNRSQQKATERQTTLIDYAANDCLSMEKLMISIQERPPQRHTQLDIIDVVDNTIPPEDQRQYNRTTQQQHHLNQQIGMQYLPNESNQEQLEPVRYFDEEIRLNDCNQQRLTEHRFTNDNEELNQQLERRSRHQRERQRTEDEIPVEIPIEHWYEQEHVSENNEQRKNSNVEQPNRSFIYSTSQFNHQRDSNRYREEPDHQSSYIDIENKKRRNRICTLKQRKRNYRHEIIRRGIDPRFSICMIKEILRRYEIPYTALNISKSPITGKTSLYIGIRNKSNLKEYGIQTRQLFTTDFYNEFSTRNHIRRKKFSDSRSANRMDQRRQPNL